VLFFTVPSLHRWWHGSNDFRQEQCHDEQARTHRTHRRPSQAVPNPVPVRIRSTGCLVSIIASIVLTVLLNLALRACVH